mmetsp:Transcript_12355/g.24808  ORF Transcript_12355/g.24808 Transcript_12355/m.24808 type:complete len:219 (+) Transcript_12355:304-960(+)
MRVFLIFPPHGHVKAHEVDEVDQRVSLPHQIALAHHVECARHDEQHDSYYHERLQSGVQSNSQGPAEDQDKNEADTSNRTYSKLFSHLFVESLQCLGGVVVVLQQVGILTHQLLELLASMVLDSIQNALIMLIEVDLRIDEALGQRVDNVLVVFALLHRGVNLIAQLRGDWVLEAQADEIHVRENNDAEREEVYACIRPLVLLGARRDAVWGAVERRV